MKKILILPWLILITISCSSTKDDIKQEPSITGKWKLVEVKQSNWGNTPTWIPITNGYTIILNTNNTFTSTQITGCETGTYALGGTNNIILTYACGNQSIPNHYNISSNNNTELILKNVYCIEECGEKFQKIE